MAPTNNDASYPNSQESLVSTQNTLDALSASTNRSSKRSGAALDLSTPPLTIPLHKVSFLSHHRPSH